MKRKIALRLAVMLNMSLTVASFISAANDTASMPSPTTKAHKPVSDAEWATLFDQNTPLAERQRWIATIEQSPDLSDPHDLYMLGSIYHMGEHAPGSPVQQNPEKASLYLGNAAIRGSVLAMAKMAELKLVAGQYREAMNWAQIYAHYALLSKKESQSREAYAAELVQRIMDHIGDSQMPSIMMDVNSFIAAYDTSIRVGMAGETLSTHLQPTSSRHHFKPVLDERAPDSGIADFIVSFKPDGSATNVQLIDAVPHAEVGAMMRGYAANLVVTSAPDGNNALRYAWIPTLLNDRRYRTTTRH